MGGRRRRDDGWDEGRGDRPDGWREPWPDDGRSGWPAGGNWPVSGYQPEAAQGGYQPVNGQGGYQPDNGQAGYQPMAAQGYQPVNGQGGYQPTAGQGGYPPANGPGGAPAYGGGQGYGYPEPGFAPTGYADSGYQDPGTGHGYSGAGYPDAGYGSGGWSGGAYPEPGYGQPGTYPANTAATWRADGEFPETSATAQYGRMTSWGPDQANGEYGPSGHAGPVNGRPSGTPRPYGRLSIFTLLEDKAPEFDRLAAQAAEGVRLAEPDTLVYVLHVVPKAPMQRIIYEIYRDRQAFESHERQPHIQRFAADRKACVLATNIIDLRLKYAKVAALSGSPEPVPAPQPVPAPAPTPAAPAPGALPQETRVNQVPRALESGWPAEGDARHAEPGYGYSPASGERVPRTHSVAWDQPVYQGQRRAGN